MNGMTRVFLSVCRADCSAKPSIFGIMMSDMIRSGMVSSI
ncbi:hypothetical protein GGP53_001211 [Salinibacter ruber]|nr:hypothetical protein [Salinibacter ruber]MCS4144271.1 hypothetical protein [Salinibacter ruber]